MDSTTSAPPPTPCAQPNSHHVASAAPADVLSRLLHRLPPTLSLPTRRRSPLASLCPHLISLSDPNLPDLLLSAASQLGYFQLSHHNIPSQLANSAELESLSLFELTLEKKRFYFPTSNWPLGFEEGEEDGNGESFCFDAESLTESSELGLSSLRELFLGLEKLGLEMIETLSGAVGFQNPLKEDPARLRTLMWIDEEEGNSTAQASWGGFYPYVVGLQYQIGIQKSSVLAESGWVTVGPQADSVMVTIGDVAQVWSNGELKKVRGRARAIREGDGSTSRCISMSLLLTLSPETVVSPLLLPMAVTKKNHPTDDDEIGEEETQHQNMEEETRRRFSSFSFEDYAWKSYHEPFPSKDPIDRI